MPPFCPARGDLLTLPVHRAAPKRAVYTASRTDASKGRTVTVVPIANVIRGLTAAAARCLPFSRGLTAVPKRSGLGKHPDVARGNVDLLSRHRSQADQSITSCEDATKTSVTKLMTFTTSPRFQSRVIDMIGFLRSTLPAGSGIRKMTAHKLSYSDCCEDAALSSSVRTASV